MLRWCPVSFKSWPKGNKFGAKKTVVDGITFDSKREAAYYGELKMRMRGEKFIFQRQVKYPLYAFDEGHVSGTYAKKVCTHVVDFVITRIDGKTEAHEVKGVETDVWKLKKKIFEANYPHIKYVVIK